VTTPTGTSSFGVTNLHPFDPNFSTTIKFGCFFNKVFLKVSVSHLSVPKADIILKISVSFGEMTSKYYNISSGNGSSRPPKSSITNFPFSLAYFAANKLISLGISL